MLSERSMIVAAKDQVSCDLADEVVVLSLKAGVYYGLNSVGARIWNLLQQPRRVGEVCAVLLKEYDIDPDSCERDLVALLRDLAAHQLIETKDDEAAS